jgi:hypothetical protein
VSVRHPAKLADESFDKQVNRAHAAQFIFRRYIPGGIDVNSLRFCSTKTCNVPTCPRTAQRVSPRSANAPFPAAPVRGAARAPQCEPKETNSRTTSSNVHFAIKLRKRRRTEANDETLGL